VFGSAGAPDLSRARYAPADRGYFQLTNHDSAIQELPAPSELNYDAPRWVVARPQYRGLNFNAGLSELGMLQSYHNAWLPPPVRVGPIQKNRNVGGAWGAGTISASTVHIPGVLVPRTVG
jgi:hypothetical protein